MSELFSEEQLKQLREAQEKDFPWGPALVRLAGAKFAELLRQPREQPTPTVILGIGAVGCQLAKATINAWDQKRRIPEWGWAELDTYGKPRLNQPIEWGQVVVVSGVMYPEGQLTDLTYQIRAQHARVTDMGVVLGERWPLNQPDEARLLGITVHPLVRIEDIHLG